MLLLVACLFRVHIVLMTLLKRLSTTPLPGIAIRGWSWMKTVRTKKMLKAPIKKRRKRILAKAFGTVTLSSKGQIVIPREIRTLMKIKPGQMVEVTAKDGVVHIVPIRELRKSERGSLPTGKGLMVHK